MRALLTICALAVFAGAGAAAEPPRAKAPPRVKGFRAPCPCAGSCVCPAGVCPSCPAPAAAPAAPQFVQVCEGGVCRLVPQTGAASYAPAPQQFAPAPQRERWYLGKLLGR